MAGWTKDRKVYCVACNKKTTECDLDVYKRQVWESPER